MFIHRISTGVSGSTLPASSAITISNPCARLVGMTKRMVFFRLSYTRRPSRTALAMVAKLSSVSTISAASLVTSVPLIPIATPTSACFSAGASFTPSPVIPTISFLLCRACTRRNLSSGLVRAKISYCCAATLSCASSITSSSRPVMAFPALPIPSILPILIAVCGWSPVIIFTRIPACRQSAIAVMASGRGGSIIPATPNKITPCCRS